MIPEIKIRFNSKLRTFKPDSTITPLEVYSLNVISSMILNNVLNSADDVKAMQNKINEIIISNNLDRFIKDEI